MPQEEDRMPQDEGKTSQDEGRTPQGQGSMLRGNAPASSVTGSDLRSGAGLLLGSSNRSDGPGETEGLFGGLSESRARKVSVIDSVPLGGALLSGMTGAGRDVVHDPPKGPDGSKGESDGPPTSRVRKVSDVIDSFGLRSPSLSPMYQPSPCFKYQSSSSQSSSTSQDVTWPPVSSKCDPTKTEGKLSADVVEHPLGPEAPFRDQAASAQFAERHSDETDTKPFKVEDNMEETEPPKISADDIEVQAGMSALPWDEEYPMGRRRRGVAAIFNNDTFISGPGRSGSTKDVDALRESLTHLGFEVAVHPNYTRTQIADELDRLVKADFDDCDCFCLAVLTHGEAPEILHAKDGIYQQRELWTPFTADKCPKLAGKPKIFFIQACRGDGRDKGVRLVRYSNSSEMDSGSIRWSYVIPTWADFLIAHSTMEGFFSWRNPEDGTWWIQKLSEELKSRGATTDLLKILTIVNRRVALECESLVENDPEFSGCKEMANFTSTLMRDLYFRPRPTLPQVLPRPSSASSGSRTSGEFLL